MKIDALIWDMDGVLIDSEPFWQAAEMAVLKTVGLELTLTDCEQTIGQRIDKVVEYWYAHQPWPMPPTIEDITAQIVNNVTERIYQEGEAKAGLFDVLRFLKEQQIRMAIASSSPLALIKAVVQRLQIEDYFDVLHSAEFERYGKPHPAVYLTTAERLGVAPQNCLVIEDSLRGILSAKTAEMHCIAIPDPSLQGDPRLSIADAVLSSLQECTPKFWETLLAQ
ncbi:MAG: 2-deoxyglucose-6-phosphatase [Phototrophicales bacterium]|nr:MAG: 2-deoxyglucose-6-phosphatase [Phototrophicales bacterium]